MIPGNASSSADSNIEESVGMSRGGTVTVLSQGDPRARGHSTNSEASIRPEEQVNHFIEEIEQLKNQIIHKVKLL